MPTPDSLTYDLTPPVRPGLDSLGGGDKKQSNAIVPDPVDHVTAPDVNQWQKQLAALARVTPNAVLTVHYSGSAYVIAACRSQGTLITGGTFTVTKNATGDVTIAWPSGTFPSPIADHEANATGSAVATATADSGTLLQVRVRRKQSDVATDGPFVLSIW